MAGAAAKAEELQLLIDSAEQGNPAAQDELGFRYEHGNGVVQDQAEALRLYTQAADQGLATAQHSAGAT